MRTRMTDRIVVAAIPGFGFLLLTLPITVVLDLFGVIPQDSWWVAAVIFTSIWSTGCGALLLLAVLIKPSKAEGINEQVTFDTEDDEEPDGLTRERV